jgi:hypothetical protein
VIRLLAPRLRGIAAEVEPGLRLEDVRRLDDVAWRQDFGAVVATAALAGAVVLGLFLSSAGIFSLMSRRTNPPFAQFSLQLNFSR